MQTCNNYIQDGTPSLKQVGQVLMDMMPRVELPKVAGHCCVLLSVLTEKEKKKGVALQNLLQKCRLIPQGNLMLLIFVSKKKGQV